MKRIALAVLCALLVSVVPAVAEQHIMAAHPTRAQLANACNSANGDFVHHNANEGGVASTESYSCTTTNCDGKGGNCSVNCGPKACTATTPIVLGGPLTLVGILQDGDNVIHVYADDDGSATPNHGGDTPPPAPSAPPP